jgi:hypothetical protein
VDHLLGHSDDKSSIGLILCKGKNRIVVEYALRDLAKPLGVSEFRQLEKLPEQLISRLSRASGVALPASRPVLDHAALSMRLCLRSALSSYFDQGGFTPLERA